MSDSKKPSEKKSEIEMPEISIHFESTPPKLIPTESDQPLVLEDTSKPETPVEMPEISIHFQTAPPELTQTGELPKKPERRRAPRFKVQLETVIFLDGVSFRTKTLNLSLSGALLAESIPAKFAGKVVDIIMIRQMGGVRDFFLLKGQSLGGASPSPRIEFTEIPEEQKKKMRLVLVGKEPA